MSVIERVGTGGPAGDERPSRSPARPSRLRWVPWALASALFAATVAFVAYRVSDDDESTLPATPTTSAPTTSLTTAPPVVPPVDTSTAVYPSGGAPGHADPIAAARGFAVDFVGFTEPVVGELQQGDSQSGEVEIRPSASGPVTTVMVRRLGDTWWVLGAATANIDLRDPSAMATISSPVRLRGTSTAFEANVSVEIRQDGARRAVGTGWVMGGSMGELGPFDGTVAFTQPTAPMGAIVLYTVSMKDGTVREAAVVRVRFASSVSLRPTSPCPSYAMPRPQPGPGQMVVTVYFTCEIDDAPVPTYRLAPASAGVLRAALEALLAGQLPSESEAGLESWFSSSTAGLLDEVVVRSGAAVVDFHDLRGVIPNASTSAGSRLLLSQLDATVFQFPSVRSVTYRIEGDCEAFTEWLQIGGCEPRLRAGT